jgi:hypothetical protein
VVDEGENEVDHIASYQVRKVFLVSRVEGSGGKRENRRVVVSVVGSGVCCHMENESAVSKEILDDHPVVERNVEEIEVCRNMCHLDLYVSDCGIFCDSHQKTDSGASQLFGLLQARKSLCLPFYPSPSCLIPKCLRLLCLGQGQVCRVVHHLRRQVCSFHLCLDA